MQKLKTRNEYVGCNNKCRFYADTIEATSYRHWTFVKVINGKVIFNGYNYSHTTTRHQHAILELMKGLDIKIDAYVDMSKSLVESSFKLYALCSLYDEAIQMIVQNHTKRVRKTTKESNIKRIAEIKKEIQNLKSIGAEFDVKRFLSKVRYYRGIRKTNEDYILFKKEYKGKIFRNNETNARSYIKSFDKDGWIVLVDYKTSRQFGMHYKRLLHTCKVCELSTILDGAA